MSKMPDESEFLVSESFKAVFTEKFKDSELSKKDFANFLGVSQPVAAKALNFGIVPSLRTLIKIADKLEVSIEFLLGRSTNENFIPAERKSNFHERLELLMQKCKAAGENVNYGKICRSTTFPRTYFYEWIKEKTLPSLDYAFNIADYFGVSIDYLLGRTDFEN